MTRTSPHDPQRAPHATDASQTIVVSYPKSGRTWLRALLGRYLTRRARLPESAMLDTEQVSVAAGLPRLSFTHDGSAMVERTPWREMARGRADYAEKSVILLGRDIRDTVVSAYFQATRRVHVFDGSMPQFIRSEQYGVEKLLAFYAIWLEAQHVPRRFLFVRYEDLHESPRSMLARVLRFAGEKSPDAALVDEAVSHCAFDNLRRMEESGQHREGVLVPGDHSDPESFKVRRGKIGGFRDYLSDEDVAWMERMIAESGLDIGAFQNRE